jgi:murein DD-endopeptidase MepM/ murein hydrolase activator NlpD
VLLATLLGLGVFVAFGAGSTAPGILPDAARVAGAAQALPGWDGLVGPSTAGSGSGPPGVDQVAPITALPDAATASPGDAPPAEGLTGYRWPIAHPRLTLPFGPTPWGSRIVAGERFHDGIDLATFCGDHVTAAHDGVVLAAGRRYDDAMGWVGDLGAYYRRLDAKHLWTTLPIVVVIDDGNGYRSVYAHFSKVVVQAGQRVRAGQRLGFEGMTGRASGCHLHYGLFSPFEIDRFAIDPAVVKRMRVPSTEVARVDPLLVLPERARAGAPAPAMGLGRGSR